MRGNKRKPKPDKNVRFSATAKKSAQVKTPKRTEQSQARDPMESLDTITSSSDNDTTPEDFLTGPMPPTDSSEESSPKPTTSRAARETEPVAGGSSAATKKNKKRITDDASSSTSHVSIDFLSNPNAPILSEEEESSLSHRGATLSPQPSTSAAASNAQPSRKRPFTSAEQPPSKRSAKEKTSKKKSSRKQAKPKRKDHILREIRMLQNSVHLLIPRAPFQRVVREIMQTVLRNSGNHDDFRMTGESLRALHESTETYLVQFFEDVNMCCSHRDRVTISYRDIILARLIRREPLNL